MDDIQTDVEFGVLKQCVDGLEELKNNPAAQTRIAEYLFDRYGCNDEYGLTDLGMTLAQAAKENGH